AVITSDEKELFSQIQSDFSDIEGNMHLFNNTNIKEMLPVLNRLNDEITTLNNKLSASNNSNDYAQDLNNVSAMLNKTIIDVQNSSTASDSSKIKQAFTDLINFAKGTTLFKATS